MVEYDSNVNIFGLGIRSAPEGSALAFTSLDAVLPLAASDQNHFAHRRWRGRRSSIVLVNTSTRSAAYSVSFWNDAGGSCHRRPWPWARPPEASLWSGSTIIETADTASGDLTKAGHGGRAASRSAGQAIFRYDPWSQEAAVPLLTSGGLKLEIPYQVGGDRARGGLCQSERDADRHITGVIRDQNGNQLASRTLTLGPLSGEASNPTFPSHRHRGGVVEYDSNVNIFGLGIRSAPEGSALAFTSVRQLTSNRSVTSSGGMSIRSGALNGSRDFTAVDEAFCGCARKAIMKRSHIPVLILCLGLSAHATGKAAPSRQARRSRSPRRAPRGARGHHLVRADARRPPRLRCHLGPAPAPERPLLDSSPAPPLLDDPARCSASGGSSRA